MFSFISSTVSKFVVKITPSRKKKVTEGDNLAPKLKWHEQSEENVRENLHDIGLGNDFLDMTQKAQAIRAKIDKWDYIKLKNFCASKDTINRVRRQPMELGKIFINHITDKRLIYRIYKWLLQLNNKAPNNLIFKRGKGLQ